MSEEAGIFGEAPETDPTLELEAELAAQDAGELVPDAPEGDAAPEQPAPAVGPARARGDEHPTVPLPEVQALRSEKARLAAELATEREKWARLDERQRLYAQWRQQEAERRAAEEKAKQQAQEDPPPDPNEDPVAYEAWERRQLQRRMDALEAQQQARVQEQQQREVAARWQRLEDSVTQSESRFIAQRPDYLRAVEHVINDRVAFWRAAGFNDAQIFGEYRGDMRAILQRERLQFLDGCYRVGPDGQIVQVADPAERMYALAHQIGYQPGGAAPAADGNGAAQAQPQQAGAVPEQQQAQTPRQVQMRQAGVAAAARQQTGGAPGDAGGALTLERVAAMDLAEFAWWNANRPDELRRVMS